jgi:hypothetical protein
MGANIQGFPRDCGSAALQALKAAFLSPKTHVATESSRDNNDAAGCAQESKLWEASPTPITRDFTTGCG